MSGEPAATRPRRLAVEIGDGMCVDAPPTGRTYRDRAKSPRASAPCVRCEAERQDLYALPAPMRSRHGRFDVCAFCYLRITGARPGPLSLVE